MKGLELLVKRETFTVQTAYSVYANLIFLGFEKENDDVILAAFSSPETLDSMYFDISEPSNLVKKV